MEELGGLYAEGRRRLSAILSDLSEKEVGTTVPACPEWTVHDVVAHLAGGCSDVLAGNVDGVTTVAWADAQVRQRRDHTMAQLLDEWSTAASRLETASSRFPVRLRRLWVLDLTVHEHDLRGALEQPGARDAAGVLLATEFLIKEGLHRQLAGRALGPLLVRTEDASWVVGHGSTAPPDGDEVALVACSTFELFRALTGRRSAAQISRFDWSVDPEPLLPAFEFGTFTTRTTDLEE